MPTVTVSRDELFSKLGNRFGSEPGVQSDQADKEFDELCFAFGVELDDVTSERSIRMKETGRAEGTDEILYKIDVPANRYDLLCIEGLSRAFRVFLGKQPQPRYNVVRPSDGKLLRMVVKKETADVRPHVVCAVLRDIHFNESSYKSFIDLQEKLHQNICRKRTLVSIGTHDLDTIEGPFSYEALPPTDIEFVPLNQQSSFNGVTLFQHIDANEPHLKKFLHIIRDKPRYPVIYDAKRRVLSLPPIINSDHSKIRLSTRNVFIEVTATDLTKAEVVLNTMCAMYSEYCATPFSVEPVEVVHEGAVDDVKIYPDMRTRTLDASVDYLNRGVGVNLPADQVVTLLNKMSLASSLSDDRQTITVSVPVTRSDVLHACDVMEDLGIAYGYDNLVKEYPKTLTYGKQQPVNKLTDQLRHELARANYSEVLTFSLCSREENYANLCRPDDGLAVTLSNPQSEEFQVARTSLLVGLLKTVAHNRHSPLPISVFEVSDVVFKDDRSDVGARNERHLAAVYCNTAAGFETTQGLLDRIMLLLRVDWKGKQADKPANGDDKPADHYELVASEEPSLLRGRRADVLFNGAKIGFVGVVHPQVLLNFGISYPCAALEINIEPFV
eukprot:TRINITY_DN9089_c0_g1_i1.p1 TRINITY_DN9089_c0_g1~~TRINITY_DN9089_c0_g1_i1.p1  ORF type:complete len:612 (-),score=186.33 TRINITY_DN9089_c0_g1_i1:153-1988(-)